MEKHQDALKATIGRSLLITAGVVLLCWHNLPFLSEDSPHYIQMAAGQNWEVIKPFCNRYFHPLLVQAVSALFHTDIHRAFLVLGVLSLGTLVFSLNWLIEKVSAPGRGWQAILLVLTPLLLQTFRDYYLPDLLHAALLGVFFIFLMQEKACAVCRIGWVILLMALFATKESTILLSGFLALICFWRRQYRHVLVVLMATLFAI